MAVLYQKYRPQKFADIVGQSHIIQTLQNAGASNTLAHAYLLTGSRGVGKTTVARLLAKAANCNNLQNGEVCSTCDICVAVEAGNFMDLVEIDAASNTGVDNVRELIEHVQFKPSLGRKKVFIIDEVHMLSKQAFNALLKTLEEPPAHAMFVLATTDAEKVPDTIISRVQRFDFHRIDATAMISHLKKIAKAENLIHSDEVLQLVVGQSEGGLRDALSLLEKLKAFGNDLTLEQAQNLLGTASAEKVLQTLSVVFSGDAKQLPALFTDLNQQGIDFAIFNRELLIWLKEILYYKLTGSTSATSLIGKSYLTTVSELATNTQSAKIVLVTRLFLRAFQELAYAPSSDLPVLLAAVEASTVMNNGTVNEAVVQKINQTANNSTVAPAPVVRSVDDSIDTKPEVAEPINVIEESQETVVTDTEIGSFNNQTVTVSEVTQVWPQVVALIREHNSPLSTLLKNSPIQDVVNGVVVIEVRYLFHKENIENKKNASAIMEILRKVTGKPVGFKAVIVKERNNIPLTETIDAISDAVKIFGGELVE